MATSEKYPIGIDSFPYIRENGFVYVDKTKYIKDLVDYGLHYLLCRPKGFGKSLLLSTIKAYFEGKKELFKGLYIYDQESDWTPHPVIVISFSDFHQETEDSLDEHLSRIFSHYEEIYEIPKDTYDLPLRFDSILRAAHENTGRRTVVLVDDYDLPLVYTLNNPELNASYHRTLKSVLSVLKAADEHICFDLVSGVSRFSLADNLCGGANHLFDISFNYRYIGICGITTEEVNENLYDSVEELASALGISNQETIKILEDDYGGYHFNEDSQSLYNPSSLMNTLFSKELKDYWVLNQTPSLLLDIVRQDLREVQDLKDILVYGHGIHLRDPLSRNPISSLFDNGFLTITGFNDEIPALKLGVPNKEMENTILRIKDETN